MTKYVIMTQCIIVTQYDIMSQYAMQIVIYNIYQNTYAMINIRLYKAILHMIFITVVHDTCRLLLVRYSGCHSSAKNGERSIKLELLNYSDA